MAGALLIKSVNGGGRLELVRRRADDSAVGLIQLTVTLASDGLQASSLVYEDDCAHLPQFFGDLAARWSGWEGERSWESIEGDLKLSCSHDSLGHIRMTVELRSLGAGSIKWTVSSELMIEAGQLDSIAEDARGFFAHE